MYLFHFHCICLSVPTGPLLPEDLDVGVIPFEQIRKLSVNLCGKDMLFISDKGNMS